MNSFMLYRSAFAERTKYWCLQNNHQVVSSVSGESWPLEPDHIRGKYNDLAKKERENHQLAHPGYKFSPSKAQNGGRKRKGPSMVKSNEDGDAASLLSDLDDIDLETVNDGSPASPQKKSNKRTQKTATGSSLIYMDLPHQTESNGAIRSSFNHNNPGKAPPMCMGTQDMNGQYYQTTVRASSATPVPNPQLSTVIEDVTIRKTQSPTALGLQHPFLLRGATVEHPQILPIKSEPDDNSNVDPALLGGSEGMGFSADQFLPSHYMQEHNGSFDFEPLFSGTGQMLDSSFGTDSTSGIQQHGMMGLGEQGSCSLADVQRLPGYDESMGGFLDNQELWSVESMDPLEESVDFDYGQWVQVSAQ
jgi:hypothetical protein